MEYLRTRNLFETDSLEQARQITSRIWHPHRSELISGQHAFHSRVNFVRMGSAAVSYVDARGAVRMTILASKYHPYTLLFPLRGTTTIATSQWQIAAVPNRLCPLPVEDDYDLLTSEHTEALIVHIPKPALHDRLAVLLRRPVLQPIAFHPSFPASHSAFARLEALIGYLSDEVDRMRVGEPLSLYLRQVEELLLTMILLTIPHRYSEELQSGSNTAAPWHVRRVEDYIVANLDSTLSMAHFARIAGVSSRTLHEGFRLHRGYTPMQFLRTQRLGAARRDIENASPDRTITEVAIQWGFTHLGRFSQSYAAAFGEKPSDTLSRCDRDREAIPA